MGVIFESTPARPAVEPCGNCPVGSQCCSRGIEVHASQVPLIESLPIPIAKPWFTKRPLDWKDGTEVRHSTVVTEKGCIFLADDLKCTIHRYCIENGLDVNKYKPTDCIDYPYVRGKLNPDYPIFCGVYFGEEPHPRNSAYGPKAAAEGKPNASKAATPRT